MADGVLRPGERGISTVVCTVHQRNLDAELRVQTEKHTVSDHPLAHREQKRHSLALLSSHYVLSLRLAE